jgi:hypothetical protein
MNYQVSEQQLFVLIDKFMKKIYGDIYYGPILRKRGKVLNIQGSSSWRYNDPEYPPFTIQLDDNGKVISMSRNFTPFEHKKLMKLTGLDEKTILKIFLKFNFNLDFADDFEFFHT